MKSEISKAHSYLHRELPKETRFWCNTCNMSRVHSTLYVLCANTRNVFSASQTDGRSWKTKADMQNKESLRTIKKPLKIGSSKMREERNVFTVWGQSIFVKRRTAELLSFGLVSLFGSKKGNGGASYYTINQLHLLPPNKFLLGFIK